MTLLAAAGVAATSVFGQANPLDPTDEIYAAARMLCTDGARDGTDIDGAIFAYCADPLVVPTWAGDPLWLLGFRLGEVGMTRRLTVLG